MRKSSFPGAYFLFGSGHQHSLLLFVIIFSSLTSNNLKGQNIGIGTPTPLAKLHVVNNSVAFSATGIAPDTFSLAPLTGAGRRMLWFAEKGAFRVGYVADTRWDGPNVGKYSFASGNNTIAEGESSVAMGFGSYAVGPQCVALGNNTVASGSSSVALGSGTATFFTAATAMGFNTEAFGDYSTAMGFESSATANSSTAMGHQTKASGVYSTAMGDNTEASAIYSVAMGTFAKANNASAIAIGDNVTASGTNSIALGSYVSTSGFTGSLTIGDNSTTTVMSTFVANGFRARFAGGYRLFTNSDANVGAFLNANANSWAALSDVRKKENFLPVNGEAILNKIAAMPQYTWNYIGQDAKTLRHYGPMGQEFYKAFGHDALGEIGCDTLINQQDFLGVNFIAIQALEKRTEEIKELKEMIVAMKKEIDELKKEKAIRPRKLH